MSKAELLLHKKKHMKISIFSEITVVFNGSLIWQIDCTLLILSAYSNLTKRCQTFSKRSLFLYIKRGFARYELCSHVADRVSMRDTNYVCRWQSRG